MILFNGTKVNKTALSFKFIFAARALLFCVALVFITDFVFQVFCVLISSLAYLGVVMHSQRHIWTDKSVKILHILNEVTVFVPAAFQLVFSAYVSDRNARS